MPHLLIDGYNLLHQLENRGFLKSLSKRRGSSELEDRRTAMIELLRNYRESKDLEISVVFDSSEPVFLYTQRSMLGGIEILFSEGSESADDHIRKMCEKTPRQYIVVSNDNEVLHFARLNECVAIKSDDMIERLQAARETKKNEAFDPMHGELPTEDDKLPLYPKVSTRKKGASRKLSKKARKKKRALKKL